MELSMTESILDMSQGHWMEFMLIQLCAMATFIAIMVLNQLINFAQKDFFSMARRVICHIECNVKLNAITVRSTVVLKLGT